MIYKVKFNHFNKKGEQIQTELVRKTEKGFIKLLKELPERYDFDRIDNATHYELMNRAGYEVNNWLEFGKLKYQ